MKQCSKCKLIKEEKDFHKNKNQKDGLNNQCKSCRKKGYKTNILKRKFDFYIKLSMIRSLKNNKSGIWEKVIGIKLEELKNHLEKQFDNKMNWSNYGVYWGVSFIIPKKFFRYSSLRSNEFLKCWNIKNIRPLSLKECKSNNKLDMDLILKYSLLDILPVGIIHLTNINKNDTF